MKKIHPMLLLTLISWLAITGFSSCSKTEEEPTHEPVRIADITVTEVKPVVIDDYYEISGTLRPKISSIISSRIMGEVRAIYVKEGDYVKKGQLLLSIDDRDYLKRVNQAGEAYEEAQRALESARQNKRFADITYERYRKLFEEKAITQHELDQVETQKEVARLEVERMEATLRRAEAGLEEARLMYGYTKIISPIDGIVTEKKIEVGNMVMPGMPLFTVEDTRNYRLEVFLDERFSGKIKKGIKVPVYIEASSSSITGFVSEIVPSIDPVSRSFLVKIDITSSIPGLRSGLYGKARFLIGKKTGILIPERAIIRRGQLTGLYAVDEKGVISYRIVRTGLSYPESGMVEILSGLNDGDRIIIEGIEKVVEGAIYTK